MKRIKKNIGREKFFHLGHYSCYLLPREGWSFFIYLFMYIHTGYRYIILRGGEVNKSISEPLGGEKSVETNKNAIGVVWANKPCHSH